MVMRVKEFERTDKNTVYRRMDSLQEQGWVSIVGQRLTKPGWPSDLYDINLSGLNALILDVTNLDEFLLTSNYEKQRKFNDALS